MNTLDQALDGIDAQALHADVVARLSEHAPAGSLLAVEYGVHIDAEDPYEVDPEEEGHREAFTAFVDASARTRLSDALDTLSACVTEKDGRVRAWRELVVPDGWEFEGVIGRPLGTCWAYDPDGAEAHWGQGHGLEGHARVVVEALVPVSGVNWAETAVLNAVGEHTVGDEKELRLREDALVEVVGMVRKPWKGPSVKLDVAHLAGMPLPAGSPEAAVHDPDYYEELHHEAGRETGFFGARGSGCLVVARSTGRILMPLRSEWVMEPGTYGTWGGALDPGLTPEQGARRELFQEAGYQGEAEFVPLLEFRPEGSTFRYQNFLALVDEEFEPVLNHETEKASWVDLGDLPGPLHFGLQALLSDPDSLHAIQEACGVAGPRP